MEKEYLFKVKTLEAGQRGSYQDSYYRYVVVTDLPEWQVKQFCMRFLKPSYEKKDMPNAFAGELLHFSKLTDNTYSYKTRELYTG